VTRCEPVANPRFIHKSRGHFTIWHIPNILLTDAASDDELNGAKLVLAKWIEGVLEGVLKSVIERDDDRLRSCRDRTLGKRVVQSDRFPICCSQFGQL